jgi:hypothetical protein
LHGLASVNCSYGHRIRNTLVRILICRIPALIHPDAFLFAKVRILTPWVRNYFYGLKPINYLNGAESPFPDLRIISSIFI